MNTWVVAVVPHRWRNWVVAATLVALTLPACLAAWQWFFKSGAGDAESRPTSIDNLAGLPQDSTVELSGIVTFVDARTRLCHLQDTSGALALTLPTGAALPIAGDRVRVRARLSLHGAAVAELRNVTVTAVAIERQGHPGLPRPEPVRVDEFFSASNTYANHLIETTAVVRAAHRDGSVLWLEINASQAVPVYVLDPGTLAPESLIDAKIGIQGVLSYRYDAGENDHKPALWVSSYAQIRVLDPPVAAVARVPSLRALVLDPQWVARGRRVRVQATVAEVESDHVLIVEQDGINMAIESAGTAGFSPGKSIEAAGWPVRRLGTTTLHRASLTRIPSVAPSPPQGETLPLLTSIPAIRELRNADADKGYPVDLVATISFLEPGREGFFVIAGSDGS